jgi:TolA-binding protein
MQDALNKAIQTGDVNLVVVVALMALTLAMVSGVMSFMSKNQDKTAHQNDAMIDLVKTMIGSQLRDVEQELNETKSKLEQQLHECRTNEMHCRIRSEELEKRVSVLEKELENFVNVKTG